MSEHNRPTSVYRYYDASDVLIYVGVTSRGGRRNLEHAEGKPWWRYVSRQEVDHYDARTEALDSEKQLIRQYRPPYNVQHNPGHREMREIYEAFAANQGGGGLFEECFAQLGKRLPLDVEYVDSEQLVLTSRIEHAPVAGALEFMKNATVHPPGGGKAVGKVTHVASRPGVAMVTARLKRHPGDAMSGVATVGRVPSGEERCRIKSVALIDCGGEA